MELVGYTSQNIQATRVEGLRLKKLLQQEIRAGAPGGRPFSPLTEMAKRMTERRSKNRRPLSRLAIPIRYRVSREGGNYKVRIGVVDPGKGKHPRTSVSWKRIARFQQEGGTRPVGNREKRLGIIHMGLMRGERKEEARSLEEKTGGLGEIFSPAQINRCN